MTPARMSIDELLVRLGWLLRADPSPTDWERQFILSVLGAAKRRGARWMPSRKQEGVMRRLVLDAREIAAMPTEDERELVLIDHD